MEKSISMKINIKQSLGPALSWNNEDDQQAMGIDYCPKEKHFKELMNYRKSVAIRLINRVNTEDERDILEENFLYMNEQIKKFLGL